MNRGDGRALIVALCCVFGSTAYCGPVAPHAGPETAALLRYLASLVDRGRAKCLVGQAVGANGSPALARKNQKELVVALDKETGRRPALLEYSVFHLNGDQMSDAQVRMMQKEIAARWAEGHLIYLSFRPAHPRGLDLCRSRGLWWFNIKDMRKITEKGGRYYRSYRESLDYAAGFLAPLQENGIIVIFELFNEFNGNWSWMGKSKPGDFRLLWRHTFDYFAKERKFANLLFCLEYAAGPLQNEKVPARDYYPGERYVDIVGFDFYHDDPQDHYKGVYEQVVALGKPVAMTEFGPNQLRYRRERRIRRKDWRTKSVDVWDNMVQADFMRKHYPRCCFFIRWSADWSIVHQKNAGLFMATPEWIDLTRLKKDAVEAGWRKVQGGGP